MSTFDYIPIRLKEIRKAYGLSQENVAAIMHCTRAAYGKYENVKNPRYPDAKQIADFLHELKKLKPLHDISVTADYLLGVVDTQDIVYAKVAETTGLTEEAIKYLERFSGSKTAIISYLLQEEKVSWDERYAEYPYDPAYIEYINSPEYLEQQYQNHLEYEEWKKTNDAKSIFEHIEDDWAASEHVVVYDEEELIKEAEEVQAEMELRYSQFEESEGYEPPSILDCIKQEESFRKQWDYESSESKKSQLLSRIQDYLRFESAYSLHSSYKDEPLSKDHSISIGIGAGKTVQFPSEECNELFEFMLIQKVIDALRAFKQRYNAR